MDESTQGLELILKSEEERKKLFLGDKYDALSLSSEEDRSALKQELLEAKKYEQDLMAKVMKNIEHEKLKYAKINSEQSVNDQQRKITDKIIQLEKEAFERLEKQQRLVEELERQHLRQTTDMIVKAEQEELMRQRRMVMEVDTAQLEIDRQLDAQSNDRPQRYSNEGKAKAKERTPEKQTSAAPIQQGSPIQQEKRLILLMTVEINQNHSDTIRIHTGDDLKQLAINFCRKHNLDLNTIDPLTEHIKANVAALQRQSTASGSSPNQLDSTTMSKVSSPNEINDETNSSRIQRHERNDRKPSDREFKFHPTSRLATATRKTSPQSSHSFKATPTIDENSRRLSESKLMASMSSSQGSMPTKKPSVFLRLHEGAVLRRKKLEDTQMHYEAQKNNMLQSTRAGLSQGTQVIMRDRSGYSEFKNVGERLYKEAQVKRQEKERDMSRVQPDQHSDTEATFKPNISDHARRIQRQPGQILDASGELLKLKRQRLLADELGKEKKECTFRPYVSTKSKNLMKKKEEMLRDKKSSHFEQLFLDAERRKIRKAEYETWWPDDFTFKPTISAKSKRKAHTSFYGAESGDEHDKENKDDVVMRLVNSKRESERYLQELRDMKMENRDPVTGREFFKPHINRYYNTYNRSSGEDIFETLFSRKAAMDEAANRKMQQLEEEAKDMANQPKSNPTSYRILQDAIRKRLRKIFDYFDDDEDGLIDPRQVRIENVDNPDFTKDLIAVMQSFEHQSYITFEEFYEAMKRRMEATKFVGAKKTTLAAMTSSFSRGASFIGNKSMTTGEDECTFRPKLDPESRKLASRRRSSLGRPLYDYLMLEKEKWDEKINSLRKSKEEQEMDNCTFTPRTNRSLSAGRQRPESRQRSRSATRSEASSRSTSTTRESKEDYNAKIEQLALRLLQSKRKLTNNELHTTEEQEVREHCSFSPRINRMMRLDGLNSTPVVRSPRQVLNYADSPVRSPARRLAILQKSDIINSQSRPLSALSNSERRSIRGGRRTSTDAGASVSGMFIGSVSDGEELSLNASG